MQLKRKPKRALRRSLLVASCALLGSSPHARADAGDWQFGSGFLYYSEAGRVTAYEPTATARYNFGDESYLNFKLTYDSLSGASPNGAMPSSTAQTFTRPSGLGTYQVASGVNPLDSTFKDSRTALNVDWSQPLSRLWRLDFGAHASSEHDFRSLGVHGQLSRDFNQRNTTVALGLSYDADSINPVGGLPTPLDQMEPPQVRTYTNASGYRVTESTRNWPSSDSRNETDLLLGVTQVMTRNWVSQLNFSYGKVSGYQNDPYKLLSVINDDPNAATPVGDPLYYLYEARPTARTRQAVYFRNKVDIGGDVLDLSLRHAWDDWGVTSDTADLRFRWAFGGHYFLQPHLRYYRQSAADFYHRGLLASDPVPTFASADYRLRNFTGTTVGLEFGDILDSGHVLRFRVERYQQSGGSDPHVNIGTQQNFDLFPGLKATIVQVSYSFH